MAPTNVTGSEVFIEGGRYNAYLEGLPPARTFIHTENEWVYRDEVFNGVECGSICDPTIGTAIQVSETPLETPITIALGFGHTVSGHVYRSGTAPLEGIAGVPVQLFTLGVVVRTATTDADGAYSFVSLQNGDYKLKTNSTDGLVNKVYGGDTCSPEACPIENGSDLSVNQSDLGGIDLQLDEGNTLTGYARDPDGNAIYGVAHLFSETGQSITSTSAWGSFTFNGLANGSYRVYLEAQSRYLGTSNRSHCYYSWGWGSSCHYHTVQNYSSSIDTLYAGTACPGMACDITSGTPVLVGDPPAPTALFDGSQGQVVPTVTSIEIEVVSGHNIRGSVKTDSNKPVVFTYVYFFDQYGTPAGQAVTDGLGNFVSESGFPDGTYYAATNRSALPTDDPLAALDALAGVSDLGLQDQAWTGFPCEDICAPSSVSNVGSPIVIDGADETGINFILSLAPGISIENLTNGIDTDTPNGGDAPVMAPEDPVTWTYQLTNTGDDDLQNIVVTDDQGVTVSCPQNTLSAGASIECSASASAGDLTINPFTGVLGNCGGVPGSRMYQNVGSVTAETADEVQVDDSDASHYCNPEANRPEDIFSDGFE